MPHRVFDLALGHALAKAAAEPLELRPDLRIAVQHMKRHRLDQGKRANAEAPGPRERKRNDATIGMGDDMRAARQMLDQRLDQPQLVVKAEDVSVRPGISASIADEIR